jgi:tetratricopeptide (TPR) repeat protein
MSKRQSRENRRAGSTKSSKADAIMSSRRKIVWVLLAALLIVGIGFCFYWRHLHQPSLPAISTARLDTASASLVEQHVNAVRKAPRSGDAWGKLAAVLRSLEFRDEARRCFEAAERLDPRNPRWPYLHALMLTTDSPVEAETHLRRAVDLCGNDPDAPRRRLAKWLAEAGRWDEAERELRELLRAQPDNPPALLAFAHVAQARGASADALSLASRCTNDRRTQRAAWTLMAVAQQRLGDTNAARAASQKAESLPPDAPVMDPFEMEAREVRADPRELSDRAQHLLTSRRLSEAAPIIQRLVRERPEFAEGWLLLGRMQFLQGEPRSAEQSIQHHLTLEPQSVNGLFQLGIVLLSQERYAEAATAFEQATKLKPDFGAAFFNLGLALARSGRKPEAMQAFREAIRHNPERIDSYLLLSDLYLQLGERAQASELLREAELINPGDRRLEGLREKMRRE